KVTLADLVELLQPEKYRLAVAGGAILVSSCSTMAVPAIFGVVIDALGAAQGTGEATQALSQAGLMMLGVTAAGSAATFVRESLLDIVGQKIGRTLRKRLYTKLLSQELAFFDVTRGGELANR
ncbi:unnamed protein product, partial [Discosporangium mesarthrocarpum]